MTTDKIEEIATRAFDALERYERLDIDMAEAYTEFRQILGDLIAVTRPWN